MLLLIDNYDSFVYNLVHAFQCWGEEVVLRRNDKVTVEEVFSLNPDLIVVGPGPGKPEEAGISKACIAKAHVPLLGVCLGHQALGEVFGGNVVAASRVRHGKVSSIYHEGKGVFRGLPQGFLAARYHSLILEKPLPACLEVTAWTEEKEIMGIRHRELPFQGVQFHPESIASTGGMALLKNFLIAAKGQT